jgi:hypothetical protein
LMQRSVATAPTRAIDCHEINREELRTIANVTRNQAPNQSSGAEYHRFVASFLHCSLSPAPYRCAEG